MMRLGATLITVQMLATVAHADTLSDAVVSVFDEVCVAPSSSGGRVTAAERRASERGWKLLRSEPAPMPMIHNENGPKNSHMSAWKLNFTAGAKANLFISALASEKPDLRHTVCIVQPTVMIEAKEMSKSIERQFGSRITPDMPTRFNDPIWFLAEDRARGNCGKQISFSLNESHDRGKPKPLLFTDFAYPSDGHWAALVQTTKCPN